MPLMFWGGQVLFRAAGLAMAAACCCEGGYCCGCPWLHDYWEAGVANPGSYRIRVTFTGALSGYVMLEAVPTSDVNCMMWDSDYSGAFDNLTTTCDLMTLTPYVSYQCPKDATLPSQLILNLAFDSGAGCTVAEAETLTVNCGPDLESTHKAVTIESSPGDCPCGAGATIDATVVNADPWP